MLLAFAKKELLKSFYFLNMAIQLKAEVCKYATLTIMKDVGYICQLGSSDVWTQSLDVFYNSLG
ncbi:MAG: hypothetical protein ACI9QN_000918 [Arcticibacterium sp.]|jgi:hypothetical protein